MCMLPIIVMYVLLLLRRHNYTGNDLAIVLSRYIVLPPLALDRCVY